MCREKKQNYEHSCRPHLSVSGEYGKRIFSGGVEKIQAYMGNNLCVYEGNVEIENISELDKSGVDVECS
jgi:hypothetical protein